MKSLPAKIFSFFSMHLFTYCLNLNKPMEITCLCEMYSGQYAMFFLFGTSNDLTILGVLFDGTAAALNTYGFILHFRAIL